MKISYAKVYVNDQEKAASFYTEKLGFVKKMDVTNGDYRWLAVAAPEEENGTQLVLELASDPAAKTFQEALYGQSKPAANFDVADVQAEYDRLKDLGVTFTTEPYEVMPGVTVAVFDDSCGNLIQMQKTA